MRGFGVSRVYEAFLEVEITLRYCRRGEQVRSRPQYRGLKNYPYYFGAFLILIIKMGPKTLS